VRVFPETMTKFPAGSYVNVPGGEGGGGDPGGGDPEPYAHFEDLDLSTVAFHTGSGDWGDQDPLQTPALPTITQTVNVETAEEFQTALAAGSGRRIVVAANVSLHAVDVNPTSAFPPTSFRVWHSDTEIEIPATSSVSRIQLLTDVGIADLSRVHIHGGGRINGLHFAKGATDVVVDGMRIVRLFDHEGDGCIHGGVRRLAIVNCRIYGRGYALYPQFGAQADTEEPCSKDIVFAGNNCWLTEYRAPGVDGIMSAIRIMSAVSSGGNLETEEDHVDRLHRAVFFRNHVRNRRSHSFRVHGNLTRHVWFRENIIDGGAFLAATGTQDAPDVRSLWLDDNEWYRNTDTPGPEYASPNMAGPDGPLRYFSMVGNDVYSTVGAEVWEAPTPETGEVWVRTGNTYAAETTPPDWNALGDPAAGIAATAIEIDASQYLTRTSSPPAVPHTTNGTGTVEFGGWIYPTAPNNGTATFGTVMGIYNSSGGGLIEVQTEATAGDTDYANLVFRVHGQLLQYDQFNAPTHGLLRSAPLNQWTFFWVVARSDGTADVYFATEGTYTLSTMSATFTNTTASDMLRIGANGFGGAPFRGRIQDIYVGNPTTPHSTDYIQQERIYHYPRRKHGIYGYYPLRSHATAGADLGGSSNSLTVNGTFVDEEGLVLD
jgi:hypothetical protein